MAYAIKTMHSPVGRLTLVASMQGLAAILWENESPTRVPLNPRHEDPTNPILQQTEQQLTAYFAGTLTTFSVPLHFAYGTPFQQQVWKTLLTIPYGETRTYLQIAQHLGDPKATRAVGAANGKNPLSIIAPCHRVIGSNGSLTGFAGGTEAKRFLLQLEATHQPFSLIA